MGLLDDGCYNNVTDEKTTGTAVTWTHHCLKEINPDTNHTSKPNQSTTNNKQNTTHIYIVVRIYRKDGKSNSTYIYIICIQRNENMASLATSNPASTDETRKRR